MPTELQNPAYQHLLINHLPITGLAFATVFLGVSLLMRNRGAQCLALALVCLSAASMVIVMRTGHEAFEELRTLVDDPGADAMDAHMHRAEKATPAYYVLAGLAAIATFTPKRWPRTALGLTISGVVLALVCLGLSVWIAQAAGPIRHAELRPGASTPAASPEHQHP